MSAAAPPKQDHLSFGNLCGKVEGALRKHALPGAWEGLKRLKCQIFSNLWPHSTFESPAVRQELPEQGLRLLEAFCCMERDAQVSDRLLGALVIVAEQSTISAATVSAGCGAGSTTECEVRC